MTNKTELMRLLRLAWGCEHVTAEDCKKIDAILAAPAEDVRAVVEESLAYGPYLVRWIGAGVWAGITDELPPSLEGKKVYVSTHPQRPMVLPERNNASQNLDLEQCGYVDGWNACLDRIAEMNK